MSHIRNEDLSKMSDKALENEAGYLYDQCSRTLIEISMNTSFIKYGCRINVPIWRLTEDYNLTAERLQMVMDEIEYRRIP